MKKNAIVAAGLFLSIIWTGCDNFFDQETEETLETTQAASSENEESSSSTNSSSNTSTEKQSQADSYTDETSYFANAVIEEDLYENFVADGIVYVDLTENKVTAYLEGQEADAITATNEEKSPGKIADTKVTISLTENVIDEASKGLVLQYKGSGKIKYVVSGSYTGTVFIKNKNADAAVILNNADIKSDKGSGPVLRFSSEKRTFIVIPADSQSSLTDTRILNQSETMYDDKKGSIYSKGPLIFTGEASDTEGGSLNIENKGYKHAVYSKDYIRIANLTLNITVENMGRDCLRSLNAVIIDGGNLNLTGKGTVTDDESVGIKVEGEDADEDEETVEYTGGAGFIIINNGNINIDTVAKGITAHWKASESYIGTYTASANNSLLCESILSESQSTFPQPYVEINGGKINITTSGTPYENTSTGESCSPEGIEAKENLTINAGTIILNCTDDAINAGGNIVINGGAIYAYSSQNDAIDANGSSGITINDGVIVAIGVKEPECAFDCDNNPLTINGGLLLGLGTNNYTAPKNCSQNTIVLSNSYYGNANSSMALVDSDGKTVFAFTLPSSTGTIMLLSSPEIKSGKTYTVKKGVSLSGGSQFYNLYTSLPAVSGGSASTTITTKSSTYIYTASNAGSNGGPQEGTRPSGPRF